MTANHDQRNFRDGAGAWANELYEYNVAARAFERAGNCSQIKGHVHELLFCDQYNMNPMNIIKGNHAQLTRSATAPTKDVIMMNNGKVIGHAQLKDTTSYGGVRKTVDQLLSGKYNPTKFYGTEETVEAVTGKLGARTHQPIHSSRISSCTTERIAGKALGRMPKAPTLGELGGVAASAGAAGAIISGGFEAVNSGIDYLNGDKEFGDMVIDVGGAAAKGGITSAGSGVAFTAAAGLAGEAITAAGLGSTVLGTSLASTGLGVAIGGTAIGSTAIGSTMLATPLAPLGVGILAAGAVGSFLSWLFDD